MRRGDEVQALETVVREHRAGVRLDEESRGEGDDEVAVSHASREERVRGGRLLIDVCVERVPGELCEVRDILERDLTPFRFEGVADAQVRQAFS